MVKDQQEAEKKKVLLLFQEGRPVWAGGQSGQG